MTRVAILWHMHQPFYQDLVTGEHILPWVRLHALKDYFGMAALLREFPGVKVTFNLVPSLLVQLEAFAADRARDRALELSLKPAAKLTLGEIEFVRANFFHAQRQRMIDRYPRYAELLARRAAPYTVDDLRDLQVWHKLAWVDPFYLDTDARVQRLVAKDRGFTEDDKRVLREVELEILNRVIPEYRDGVARGQIEVSASPFYHPILPLLCDTDVYLRTHPESRPSRRFEHPEDAAEQLQRAADYHASVFGRRPEGLWPSEGSVSDAMVPLAHAAGFRWMATDELILSRTLGLTFSREAAGHLEQPERLYAPYRVAAGGKTIACAFRDHVLSDLIGFTYAGWSADRAADDFIGRLVEAGRRFEQRTGGEDAFIPVILDGENAWEHFEGGGRPFLRALYGRLASHSSLTAVTMSEGCAGTTRELAGIFPGSWIDGNFYIWIGHADDQRAWAQLADARAALDAADRDSPDLPAAREEILIAEGSDWCWWYGDDHSSAHDLEFDDLFRRHLRNAYGLMGKPAPDELFVSNISGRGRPAVQTDPTALLSPTLDGAETSYFEWLGAGVLELRETAGAMHQVDRRPALLTEVRFGFDRTRLFVRVDARQPMGDLLADGHELSLKFLTPPGLRFSASESARGLTFGFWDRMAEPPYWIYRGERASSAAAGRVLEMAVALADLDVEAGAPIAFFVAVYDRQGSELERHPGLRAIELVVPDALFEARHWRA
jgi:alpha-amylase/alpha-mannosidase (GH57 family)